MVGILASVGIVSSLLFFSAFSCSAWADEGAGNPEPIIVETPETLDLSRSEVAGIPIISNPATIEVGIPCDMDWMCGLDPCLCGTPDSWGACACNGLETIAPTYTFSSSDESVVRVITLGDQRWLVPMGTGETKITVTAHLQHYSDATSETTVVVAPLSVVDVLRLGGMLLIMVAIAIGIAWGSKAAVHHIRGVCASRRAHRKLCHNDTNQSLTMFLMIAPLVIVSLSPALSGCIAKGTVSETSPHVKSYSISSASALTESSQCVTVFIVFDAPIVVSNGARDDFTIMLNGAEPDANVITTSAVQTGADSLCIKLAAAEGVGNPSSGLYFAVYEGELSITARDASGALAHISRTDDADASAVLAGSLDFQIPSGLSFGVLTQTVGSSSDDVPASTVFEVTATPVIRAVARIELEPGGTCAVMHNHEFTRYDDSTCDIYAQSLVECLRATFGDEYTFSVEGDAITVTAQRVEDGQTIEPRIIEGVLQ